MSLKFEFEGRKELGQEVIVGRLLGVALNISRDEINVSDDILLHARVSIAAETHAGLYGPLRQKLMEALRLNMYRGPDRDLAEKLKAALTWIDAQRPSDEEIKHMTIEYQY